MNNDAYNALVEECANCVPTNWLDPLLSGPDKVIPDGFDNRVVENLLKAVAARIREMRAAR